jgi:2-aminoadipate transaminase
MEPTAPPTSTRLDPWVESYAARTRGLTASQVRALFAVASRPEVVSLAGGMPFVSALPLDAVADTVASRSSTSWRRWASRRTPTTSS